MNLKSNLSLYFLTDRFDNLVLKSLIDFPLVIINRNIWLLMMLNIPEHFKRITKCHQEIIQLIWSL